MTKREAIAKYVGKNIKRLNVHNGATTVVETTVVGWKSDENLDSEFDNRLFLIVLDSKSWDEVGAFDYIMDEYLGKTYLYIGKEEIVSIVDKKEVVCNFTQFIKINDELFSVEYQDRNYKTFVIQQQMFFAVCQTLTFSVNWCHMNTDDKVSIIEQSIEALQLNIGIKSIKTKVSQNI